MSDQPSILLIVTYFGPLPSYVDLFFRSCGANPTVNWLLITDQSIDRSRLPSNVATRGMTFAELRRLADARLGIATALTKPYKICDLRPAFGVLFAEDTAGFDFWGHSDVDVVLGDIRKFLTPQVLASYDKVLIHGHLSIYRNCETANHYFQLDAPGVGWRDAFTSPKSLAFDEFGGLRLILNHHRIPFFRNDDYIADIDAHFCKLKTIQPPNYEHQCFYWEQGRVFKEFWDSDMYSRQEYMYIHLQKRRPAPPPADLARKDTWFITPQGFAARQSGRLHATEMDRINPSNVVFDTRQRVLSSIWRLRWTISQMTDPWPRRAS